VYKRQFCDLGPTGGEFGVNVVAREEVDEEVKW